MRRTTDCFTLAGLLTLAFTANSGFAMSVTLTPSATSPAPVGALITWNASASDDSGALRYRFRVRPPGGDFHMVRDFRPETSLDWTGIGEGIYQVEVSVKNRDTGDTAVATSDFQMLSRVTDSPAVTPTSNPLVFLFSAPPCGKGSRIRIYYRSADGFTQQTPFMTCNPKASTNVYIAGLLANTTYSAWPVIQTDTNYIAQQAVSFATGDSNAPKALFQQSVVQQAPAAGGFLVASSSVAPAGTDLNGNLVWYASNGISLITSVDPGGYFWGMHETAGAPLYKQQLVKFDLTGMTVVETNAERVNEQLSAMGRRTITAFHHDAKTTPDGHIVALAALEQIMTDVQGAGPVDILGDMIIVFDREMNVVWTWDTFDNLDPQRAAVLGEVCTSAGGGCPPYYLSTSANDWTHGNSVQQTPDGNLVYSARHQDWLVKIAYDNGNGDGHVIWKLGKDGDFQFNSTDAYPWFSHQHDANFPTADSSTLLVFDNGNTRVRANNGGNSRGQMIQLDEQNRTATLLLNADLGVYSLALGTAQKLSNGDYNFDAGYTVDPSSPAGSAAYSVEVGPDGNIVYEAKANAVLYRWWRMTDLYTLN